MEQWHQVRELFDQVCELPPERWEPELSRLTGDPQLVARTLELLQAQTVELGAVRDQVSRLIQQVDRTELKAGDRVGPWRLQRCLARGGMGQIHLAERADGMYEQQVAIKLLPGLSDENISAQLMAERRILASLQHPNIARLYDAGTTPSGQPYFVMEYIQGQPLDQWCQSQGLNLKQRLQLFAVICQAVQEAHARLVLHCDLKPANILIRDDGQPVLVDFGIGRLLDSALVGEKLPYCTSAYAAPELLHGQSLPDTRSDVFSLGVLLAELLSGQVSARGLSDWNTPVCAPSAVAGADCAWRNSLSGDLDAIVARACALEPEQRYGSVAAMAQDLRNHLQRRPLLARGNGRFYRGKRWLQRNWKWLLLLFGLLAMVAGFVYKIEQQRQRAEEQARIAGKVSDFMVAMFEAANPRTRGARGNQVITAEDVLDQAAERIDGSLNDAPLVRARLQGVIGQAYRSMGHVPKALPLIEQSARVLAAEGGASNIDEAARLFNMLSAGMAGARDGVAGEGFARQALALLGEVENTHFRQAQSQNSLGLSLLTQQRYAEALEAFQQAHDSHSKAGREFYVGVSTDNIGMLHRRAGNAQAALEAFSWSTPMFLRVAGEHSFDYWTSSTEYAMALVEAGQLDQAIAIFQRNLAVAPDIFGEHSHFIASETLRLGSALLRKGDLQAARDPLEQAVSMHEATVGMDSFGYSLALATLAQWHLAAGNAAQAQALSEQVLDIRDRVIGTDNPDTHDARLELAIVLLETGQLQQAAALLEQLQAAWLPVLDSRTSNSVRIRHAQVSLLLQQGQWQQAQQLLQTCADDAQALTPHLDLQQQALQARLLSARQDAQAQHAWTALVQAAQALYGDQSAWTLVWLQQAAAAGQAAAGG